MTYRTFCKCDCHINPIHIIHIQPCCYEDPTINKSWESFKDKVIHPEASEIQVHSMKMAFYAGFTQMMLYLEELGKAVDNDEQSMFILNKLRTEYMDFYKSMKNDSPSG